MQPFENRKTLFRSTLVAAALAVGLGAASSSRADTSDASTPQPHSDSVGAAISDTVITAQLKARYLAEDRLKGSDIKVTTTNGVVTLAGTLAKADSKQTAIDLAKDVEGVKSVDSEDLDTPSVAATSMPAAQHLVKTTKRAVSDSVITAKVKSVILADDVSKGFEVSVSTQHGVVMLSGNLANPDAIDHVKDIAEKVAGVKSVDTSRLTSGGG